MRALLLSALLFAPIFANAFPEMIRYGYVNCTACHTSPGGGGVLTPYGRGLSAELLSTWGSEKEAQFLHGAINLETVNEWLSVGGDYRGLQYHYENDQVKDGQWINMQGALEAAIRIKNWVFNYAFGRFEENSSWSTETNHYYVMFQPNDYLSFRAGRFLPQFGLSIPEHISPTRGPLGFGANDERNAAEAQFANENWTVTCTYSIAPKDLTNSDEKAWAVKIERVFADTLKPGISYWSGDLPQSRRQILGLHGLLGFTKKFFWLTEFDWQEETTKSTSAIQRSGATYQKWGYEFHKGVIGLLVADAQRTTLESPATQTAHYGLGIQFFPRPHFELEGVWMKERAPQITAKEGDYAWLLLHYYL